MASGRHRLRTTQLATKKPCIISDGDGLYLRTTKTKSGNLVRSWVFIYHKDNKRREMGLGAYGAGTTPISLARARQKAQEARELLADGIDPIDAKRKERGVKTFGEVADDYLATHKPGWTNKNHIRQWERSLTVVCKPIRSRPINQIDTEDVLSILKPIWTTTPEVGRRVRIRIEAVLDYASSKGLRGGDNPARGKGHIFRLLPKQEKTVQHMAALPYAEMPGFWKKLAGVTGSGGACLRFDILTASRPGEAREATWSEIDMKAKLWTVPASRMKEGREHRVPLTDQAIAELVAMQPENPHPDDYVFPGQRKGRPMSDMSLTAVLRRLDVPVTVHGFRSTFRDWVAEQTDFPGEVAEAALSHAYGDATERAYRRGDALAKRRKLMEAWANFCAGS